MRVLTSFIGLVILCGCAHTSAPRADHGYRTVSLPRVALTKGERIESVEIEITGAGFTAVHRIPLDWSVEVHTDAGVSYFQGEAGHGVGWLSSSDELDDFIAILVYDSRNFTIKGKVFIASPDTERAVSFKGADYPMKPSPNQSPEPTAVGAVSSAVVVHAASRRWLSFFR
jgi:hypothetical protein